MLAWPVSRRMVMARRAGYDAWSVAGADLGAVLVVGDVASQCSRSSIPRRLWTISEQLTGVRSPV